MEDFEKYFECPICLDIAEEPMECNSCSNIFCQKCVEFLKNSIIDDCPVCKSEADFKHCRFAKRLLKNIPVQCKFRCGLRDIKNSIKIHERICPKKIYECFLCKQKKSRQDFLNHIILDHSEEAFNFFTDYTQDFSDDKEEDILCNSYYDKNNKNIKEKKNVSSLDKKPAYSNRFYTRSIKQKDKGTENFSHIN